MTVLTFMRLHRFLGIVRADDQILIEGWVSQIADVRTFIISSLSQLAALQKSYLSADKGSMKA